VAQYFRRRSKIHLPITLSVSLMALNVTLMICWIILLAQRARWGTLTVGVVAFTMILVGISIWLVLTLKEIALNNRQANFVDSVTHELKSPIAALQLYLETLRLRNLSDEKRAEFHKIMEAELHRLDRLINQLLEVGRLDAIGENDAPTDVRIDTLIREYAQQFCGQWKLEPETTVSMEALPAVVRAPKILLDLIFSNLVENALKYSGDPPEVVVRIRELTAHRIQVQLTNNGPGVPREDRKKIFQIFYRGGSELERRRKGTGLGLYIVQTLVKKLRGRVAVQDRADGRPGVTFLIDLPGFVDKGVDAEG